MSIESVVAIVIVLLMSFALTRFLIPVLTKKSLIDHPNERSSHIVPTPRGGGWAIVVPILAVLIYKSIVNEWADVGWAVIVGAIVLSAISWLDDVRSLSVKVRLLIQFTVVVIVVAMTPFELIQSLAILPTIILSIILVLAWVWFINLYNFMDGIDGISSVETIFICVGIAAVYWISEGQETDMPMLALIIASATAGFLFWNWSPAKIFMGDIGSVFLGFIIGWLLIGLAMNGHWAAAFILPLYYLADTTITLCRRALRGDRFWEAHREHFYQRAHQAGLSHRSVVYRIAIGNLMLVGLAIWSVDGSSWIAMAGAICVTAGLLFELSRRPAVS